MGRKNQITNFKINNLENIIYHITEKNYLETQLKSGQYLSSDFSVEGFIHLSTKTQVENSLIRHFAGKKGLVLLQIDYEKLAEIIKYEEATNGELFPHCYGPIPIDAIMMVEEIN